MMCVSDAMTKDLKPNPAPFTLPGGTVQTSVEEDQRGDRENSEDTMWLVHRTPNARHVEYA